MLQRASRGCQRPTIVERVPFFDGSTRAELSVTSPAGEKTGLDATAARPTVVLWNGLLSSRRMNAQLAHLLASQGLAAVTYDDPPNCYDVDVKASRGVAATRRVSDVKSVTAVVYSQAALGMARAGTELVGEERIDSVALVAPAGVVPHPEIPTDLKDVNWRVEGPIILDMLTELVSVPRMVSSRQGVAAAVKLPATGLWHGLRWRSLVREVHSTLTADVTDELVAVGGLARMGALGGVQDRYFPATPMAASLGQAGFPGAVDSYPGNHVSPMFDATTAYRIGALVHGLQSTH